MVCSQQHEPRWDLCPFTASCLLDNAPPALCRLQGRVLQASEAAIMLSHKEMRGEEHIPPKRTAVPLEKLYPIASVHLKGHW